MHWLVAHIEVIVIGVLAISTARADTLLLSSVVHRHGDRSPTTCFPVEDMTPQCANQWPQGFGQLSPEGMAMGAQLGGVLRQRYIEDLRIVRQNYTRIDTIVRSTDYDRTLQTSESVLQELFPPGSGQLSDLRLQVVPEHTVATGNDRLLRAWTASTCERFATAGDAERRAHSGAWAAQDAKLSSIRDALAAATGLPPSSLTPSSIYIVADTALCNMDHGYPLPSGFTSEMYNLTSEVGDWSLAHLFNTTLQQQLAAGRLVGELSDRAAAARDGRPQPGFDPSSFAPKSNSTDPRTATGPRLALYSAHDATLVALLQALGAYDGVHPSYASSVAIEIWSTSIAANRHSNHAIRAAQPSSSGLGPRSGSDINTPVSRMEQFMQAANRGLPLPHLDDTARLSEGTVNYADGISYRSSNAGLYYYVKMYYNKESGQGKGFRNEDIVIPSACDGQPGNTPGVPSDASCSLDVFLSAASVVAVHSDAEAASLCAHASDSSSGSLLDRSFDFTAISVSCAVSLALGALLMGLLLAACGCKCIEAPSQRDVDAATFGGGGNSSQYHAWK